MPGDQFLAAALNENPGLLDEAIRQGVILATPTSFIAMLKAIAYGWRQLALAQNAETIRDLGEELYQRLSVFGDHLGKIGEASIAASMPTTARSARSNDKCYPPRAASPIWG